MEFATFCNICLNTDNEVEEHENVSNILVLFIGNLEIIKKSKVYLCRSCCIKLDEYQNLRNMCITNILEFRYLYFELKRKLEIDGDPDMYNKLSNFIYTKVYNKGDDSVYENSETTCVASKNDVCSTITAYNDIKPDIEIKCEDYTIHSETDLDNEIPTHLETLQDYSNTYFIKMEDVCTAEVSDENEFEHKLHTEIDLGNDVVSLDLQASQDYNAYSNIEREGVRAVNLKKENANAEDFSRPVIQEKEKFPIAATSSNYEMVKPVYSHSHSTQKLTQDHNVRIDAKSHTCSVCEKAFTKLSKLKSHQQIHSGNNKSYICNMCDKTFTHLLSLKQHERIHSGEKPYICTVCDKAFTFSSTLNKHQRTHSGDKPYKCNMCNKAFSQSCHLIEHQRIHSGHKPYKCDMCDKAFTFSYSLVLHQRFHSGDKPYICNVCNKAFVQSSHLKEHERIHSGHRPYTCNVCNKAFTQSAHMKEHQRIHSGDRPYICDMCDKAFNKSSALRQHKRVHSGNKRQLSSTLNTHTVIS